MKLQNPTNSVTLVLVALGLVIPAHAASMLYAPTSSDNPTFRSQLSALIGGPVDYWNAYTQGTPSVTQLLQYDAVFTWCNYPYSDAVAMGDNLADYVDQGGRVILGQWCFPSGSSNHLDGRIMEAAYCPVAALGHVMEEYTGGGTDCVHDGVGSYYALAITLQPGAVGDGWLPSGGWATAWRADRGVYLSGLNGNLQLIANMVLCAPPDAGDLNCDGAVNAFDIDPFVLALTSPPTYATQFADCDYMLADCNGDGEVNAFDIDPFVALLTGAE
jgi:hypothetical protein